MVGPEQLRGGEAWDASVRKQIKTCALFLPVISENTSARAEGYLRLEWKLAVAVCQTPVHKSGYVLIRTSDLTNPNGWQGWNGSAYLPMTNLDFLTLHPQTNGVAVDGASPQLIHDTVANCFVLPHTLYSGSNPVYYLLTTSLANPSWSDSAPIGGSAQRVIDPAGAVQGFNLPTIRRSWTTAWTGPTSSSRAAIRCSFTARHPPHMAAATSAATCIARS